MHTGYVKIIKSVKIGGRQFTQGRGCLLYTSSRAVLAAAGGSVARAGFENEISQAVAARINKIPEQHGFYIPADVLRCV